LASNPGVCPLPAAVRCVAAGPARVGAAHPGGTHQILADASDDESSNVEDAAWVHAAILGVTYRVRCSSELLPGSQEPHHL
jgi:hypothetical protein